MSQKTCIKMLIICIFVGVLYFADICTMIFIGDFSNFVVFSNVWVRYIFLAGVIAFICINPFSKKQDNIVSSFVFHTPQILFICGVFSLLVAGVSFVHAFWQFIYPSTNFGHIQSNYSTQLFAMAIRYAFTFSLVFYGVFNILISKKDIVFTTKKIVIRNFGLVGILAFCFLPIIIYSENPSSVHRIVYIFRVCASLAALLFAVKFLGLFFVKSSSSQQRTLVSIGLVAFLLCTCITIPNTIFMLISGNFLVFDIATNILFIIIGIIGAITSLSICLDKYNNNKDKLY